MPAVKRYNVTKIGEELAYRMKNSRIDMKEL